MSLYQCHNCGCCENTACANYWMRKGGPELCSACDPKIKKWHGQFERSFYPKGMMNTDADGNLAKGSKSIRERQRNSPSIEPYLLGYGDDFDWKKANEEYVPGSKPNLKPISKLEKTEKNRAKRRRKK